MFVRDPSTETWSQQAYLKASNVGSADRFGWSVDIDGDTLAAGAYAEDETPPLMAPPPAPTTM